MSVFHVSFNDALRFVKVGLQFGVILALFNDDDHRPVVVITMTDGILTILQPSMNALKMSAPSGRKNLLESRRRLVRWPMVIIFFSVNVALI